MKILLVDDLPKSLHLRGLRVQMSTKELPKKVWGSFSHHSSKLEPQMSHSRRSRRSNCKRFTQCNITQQCDTQWHFFFVCQETVLSKRFQTIKDYMTNCVDTILWGSRTGKARHSLRTRIRRVAVSNCQRSLEGYWKCFLGGRYSLLSFIFNNLKLLSYTPNKLKRKKER